MSLDQFMTPVAERVKRPLSIKPFKVACYSTKGGVSKTTLALNLSDCLAVDHILSVLLVDVDPQRSSFLTAKRLKLVKFDTITIDSYNNLDESELSRYDVILLDFPPSLNINTIPTDEVDLVIIPAQPNLLDITSLSNSNELIAEHCDAVTHRVWTRVDSRSAFPNMVIDSDNSNPSIMPNRQLFADVLYFSGSVFTTSRELRESKSFAKFSENARRKRAPSEDPDRYMRAMASKYSRALKECRAITNRILFESLSKVGMEHELDWTGLLTFDDDTI